MQWQGVLHLQDTQGYQAHIMYRQGVLQVQKEKGKEEKEACCKESRKKKVCPQGSKA